MALQRNCFAPTRLALATLATLLCASAAHAEIGVSADLGTTGIGASVVLPMEKDVNARLGIHYLSRSFNDKASTVDYHLKADLKTVDAIFDWYPGASLFHVSAGLIYNGNEASAKGKPNSDGKYTINGKTYTAANVGTLKGNVDFRKAAPYLGIGWGNALASAKKLSFSADVGAFYQGKPNTSLVSVGCSGTAAVCKALASDVAAENVKFADKIEAWKFYPVVRVGMNYAF